MSRLHYFAVCAIDYKIVGDKNEDRRMTVRYDIQKYLLRAEKIYNMHLSPEIRNFQEIVSVDLIVIQFFFSILFQMKVEKQAPVVPQQIISELYKYKVIKVVGSGMLVLHSELHQPYFVKVR